MNPFEVLAALQRGSPNRAAVGLVSLMTQLEEVVGVGAHRVGLREVLVRLCDIPGLQWLQAQLVWQCGSAVEMGLFGGTFNTTPDATWWDVAGGLGFGMDDRLTTAPRERKRRLSWYLKKGVEVIGEKPLDISICFDASRTARKSLTLFAAMLPSNVGIWLPPQVRA